VETQQRDPGDSEHKSHRPNGGVNHGAMAIGKKMIEVGANLYSGLETGGNYQKRIWGLRKDA